LRLITDSGLVDKELTESLLKENDELISILTKIVKSSEEKRGKIGRASCRERV
jgi:hypothetical protein